MNIRIKELFKSDLDPNSNEWWSKDKIDKINFNFNLLRNGGPSGPSGLEGPNGVEGDKGETGTEGNQGPFGFQGIVGPSAVGSWKSTILNGVDENENNYYQKVIWPSVSIGVAGMAIPVIGTNSNLDANGDYLSPWYGTTATTPINLGGSGAFNVLTNGAASIPSQGWYSSVSSFSLDSDDSSHYFNFGINNESDPILGTVANSVFEIKPNDASSGYRYEIDFQRNINFNFISNFGNINTLGENSVINYPLYVDATQPGKKVEFVVGGLKFNHQANLNNVLKSNDNIGTVTWENVSSLFSVLPIGSIVKIPSTSFNSSNFYTDNATVTDLSTGGTTNIRTNFGAGRPDGMFGAWYLCNGRKWGDGGIISYDTPNLNGFHYSFEVSSTSNPGKSIYGGSETSLSTDTSTGVITQSHQSGSQSGRYPGNIENNYGDENHIVFGEHVSIIFLGSYGYEWSNLDSTTETTDFSAGYHEYVDSPDQDGFDISARYAASLNPVTRQWTADISGGTSIDTFWLSDASFTTDGTSNPSSSTGIRVYENGIEVDDGWFFREQSGGLVGIARYYENGTGFTGLKHMFEPQQSWMWYGESVWDVDGNHFDTLGATSNGTTVPLSTIQNSNDPVFVEMHVSSSFHGHPNSTSNISDPDFTDYESNSHIWSVDSSSNQIVIPTTGWWRSITYTDSYTVTTFSGVMFSETTTTIDAGYQMTYRKYWSNGDNEFKGDIIKDNYIPWNDSWHLASGANSSSIACSNGGTDSLTFYSGNAWPTGWLSIAGNSSNAKRDDFTASLSAWYIWDKIYVRADANHYSSTTPLSNRGKHPLVLVNDGPIIGEQPNIVIADTISSKYREIDSASMASALSDCSGGSGFGSGYVFNFTDINPGSGSGNGTVVAEFDWDGPNLSTSNFSLTNLPTGVSGSIGSVDNSDETVNVNLTSNTNNGINRDVTLSLTNINYQMSQTGTTSIQFNWGPCHVEGTLITMSNGKFKKVENLQIGDSLSSYKIGGLRESGEWRNFKVNKLIKEASTVTVVNIVKGTHISYMDINKGLTKITSEHPVLVKHNNIIQFKQAGKISLGEFIYVNEKWTKVFSNEYVKETSNTYSIDVEADDVYIADGVLCHNQEQEQKYN